MITVVCLWWIGLKLSAPTVYFAALAVDALFIVVKFFADIRGRK